MTLNSPCCHQTAHNQVSAPSLGAWLIVTSNYPHYFVILRYVAMICVVLCHILASSLYLEFWDLTEDKYRGLHDFQVRKAHLRYGCFNMLFSKSYLFVNLGLKIEANLLDEEPGTFLKYPDKWHRVVLSSELSLISWPISSQEIRSPWQTWAHNNPAWVFCKWSDVSRWGTRFFDRFFSYLTYVSQIRDFETKQDLVIHDGKSSKLRIKFHKRFNFDMHKSRRISSKDGRSTRRVPETWQ